MTGVGRGLNMKCAWLAHRLIGRQAARAGHSRADRRGWGRRRAGGLRNIVIGICIIVRMFGMFAVARSDCATGVSICVGSINIGLKNG